MNRIGAGGPNSVWKKERVAVSGFVEHVRKGSETTFAKQYVVLSIGGRNFAGTVPFVTRFAVYTVTGTGERGGGNVEVKLCHIGPSGRAFAKENRGFFMDLVATIPHSKNRSDSARLLGAYFDSNPTISDGRTCYDTFFAWAQTEARNHASIAYLLRTPAIRLFCITEHYSVLTELFDVAHLVTMTLHELTRLFEHCKSVDCRGTLLLPRCACPHNMTTALLSMRTGCPPENHRCIPPVALEGIVERSSMTRIKALFGAMDKTAFAGAWLCALMGEDQRIGQGTATRWTVQKIEWNAWNKASNATMRALDMQYAHVFFALFGEHRYMWIDCDIKFERAAMQYLLAESIVMSTHVQEPRHHCHKQVCCQRHNIHFYGAHIALVVQQLWIFMQQWKRGRGSQPTVDLQVQWDAAVRAQQQLCPSLSDSADGESLPRVDAARASIQTAYANAAAVCALSSTEYKAPDVGDMGDGDGIVGIWDTTSNLWTRRLLDSQKKVAAVSSDFPLSLIVGAAGTGKTEVLGCLRGTDLAEMHVSICTFSQMLSQRYAPALAALQKSAPSLRRTEPLETFARLTEQSAFCAVFRNQLFTWDDCRQRASWFTAQAAVAKHAIVKIFRKPTRILCAPTDAAVDNLKARVGGHVMTLQYFTTLFHSDQLRRKIFADVGTIVVDEMGMVDEALWTRLLYTFPMLVRLRCVIGIGDPGQLGSVSGGNVLADLQTHPSVATTEFSEVMRVSESKHLLRTLQTVVRKRTADELRLWTHAQWSAFDPTWGTVASVAAWLAEHPDICYAKAHQFVCYRNVTVDLLNALYLQAFGFLSGSAVGELQGAPLHIAELYSKSFPKPWARWVRNAKHFKIRRGLKLKVKERYDGLSKKLLFVVLELRPLDAYRDAIGQEEWTYSGVQTALFKSRTGRQKRRSGAPSAEPDREVGWVTIFDCTAKRTLDIKFRPSFFDSVEPGFAVTAYGMQGGENSHIHILPEELFDSRALYTALTRAKEKARLWLIPKPDSDADAAPMASNCHVAIRTICSRKARSRTTALGADILRPICESKIRRDSESTGGSR